MKLVAVISSHYPPHEPVAQMRRVLALTSLEILRNAQIPVVVVDTFVDPTFVDQARALGAVVVRQQGNSMGSARRQGIAQALTIRGCSHVLYAEAEKVSLFQMLPAIIPALGQVADALVVIGRESLESYPEVQRNTEAVYNRVINQILGREFDLMFGARVMPRHLTNYFLDYHGEYGDLWDSIFVPVLRALVAGESVESLIIPYQNDPSQTALESNRPEMHLKRVTQLQRMMECSLQELASYTAVPLQQAI